MLASRLFLVRPCPSPCSTIRSAMPLLPSLRRAARLAAPSACCRHSRTALKPRQRRPPVPWMSSCSSTPGRDSVPAAARRRLPAQSSKWMQQRGNTSCTAARTRPQTHRPRRSTRRGCRSRDQRMVQRRDVGAEVDHHRQQTPRRHAGTGGVELELADRDAHAVAPRSPSPSMRSPEVTRITRTSGCGQLRGLLGPFLLLHRHVHAARAAVDMAELQARLADGRVVDDREQVPGSAIVAPIEQRSLGSNRPPGRCSGPGRSSFRRVAATRA